MTAETLKNRFRWLESFSDDELREISFCLAEEPLHEGEQYVDVSHPERGVIRAQAGQRVPEGSCYVGGNSVSGQLWQKLVQTLPTGR